jgi:autotransporter-associated beta strand protein
MGGAIFVQQGGSLTIAGSLSVNGSTVTGGAAGLTSVGPGLTTTAGSAFGSGLFLNGNGTITFAPGTGQTQTFADVIADQNGSGGSAQPNGNGGNGGSWNLVLNGPGTLTLGGVNAYTGATNVTAGTLNVTGSIAASSLTTVSSGATLIGTGTVGNTQVNSGGTFAPGPAGAPGTMAVSGNLAFQSGAIYLVQVSPSTASKATVSGTATLAGSVSAVFTSGTYLIKSYDILHAAGGLGGTTFAGVANTNLPPGTTDSLSYSATDVFLNLTAALGTGGGGLNQNQQNVANSINAFFNNGGALPPSFVNLLSLTGGNLAGALSQLSGEVATDADKGAFQLMNQFLDLMVDPFVAGRGTSGAPMGYAQDASFPPDVASAYAQALKAPGMPLKAAPASRPGWGAWGASYGGTNQTKGDPVLGSNDVAANDFGVAAGLDYHATPDTVVGFALAGGGTGWNLAQGLGSGRSDAFQGGIYGTAHWGDAYVAADAAFANHWFTTNRTAVGDQLTARFNGQSFGARLEAGYRFGMPAFGVAPYAAVQAQSFRTPTYSETDLNGGGFGLTYNAMNATDTRSELGDRFDLTTTLGMMPLILRSRFAWAHDWVSNPALGAVFQALPGASFVVNGAAPPKDSGLASASAELRLAPAWSLTGKFDGEFARGSQTYAGTGIVRYTW